MYNNKRPVMMNTFKQIEMHYKKQNKITAKPCIEITEYRICEYALDLKFYKSIIRNLVYIIMYILYTQFLSTYGVKKSMS